MVGLVNIQRYVTTSLVTPDVWDLWIGKYKHKKYTYLYPNVEDQSSLYKPANNSWSLANNKYVITNVRPENVAKDVTITFGMTL